MRTTTPLLRGIVLTAVGVATLQPAAAQAGSFAPPCLSDQVLNNIALVDALEKANDELSFPGADTVALPAGCHYLLTDEYADTGGMLPPITSAVTIVGNGATVERQDPDSANGIAGGGGNRLLTVTSDGDLAISGLTLLNGAGVEGGFIGNRGHLTATDMVLRDSAFGNNDSAVRNWGTAYLQRVMFDNNDRFGTGGFGGAVSNEGGGHLVLVDSTLRNATVRAGVGTPQAGGGLANAQHGFVEVYGSTFADNNAGGTGGAIVNGGDLRVHGSTFTANSANFGGAIQNAGALLVDTSYFADNLGRISGGGIHSLGSGATAEVTNTTFHHNSAGSTGAGTGGAIANVSSFAGEALTFDDNRGVGAALWTDVGAVSRLKSSVLAGFRKQCAGDGVTDDRGGNLVQDPSFGCSTTFLVGDPRLAAPAANGTTGPLTQALGPGSDAVDRLSAGCTSSDQRGMPRDANACDIGAFENQVPTAPGAPAQTVGSNPTRTGELALAWSAADDPDGTVPCYRLQRKDSDDVDFGDIATPCSPAVDFSGADAQPEGRVHHRVLATDGLATVAGAASDVIVIDRTAPSAPALDPDRPADYAPAVGDAWWADRLTLVTSGSTDPALADGSAGTGVAGYTTPQDLATTGAHVVSGTATDDAGNAATTTGTFRVDATAPVVGYSSCPATQLKGHALTLAWAATDAGAGLETAAHGSQPVDVSTVGPHTYTAVATDHVGHRTSVSCTVQVVYDFTGPYAPLSSTSYTTATAGRVLPVQFNLAGNQGFGVLLGGAAQTAPVPCGAVPALTTGVATSPTRAGLSYDSRTGIYTYSWKTVSTWAGTCRVLIIALDDGTAHRAYIQFR